VDEISLSVAGGLYEEFCLWKRNSEEAVLPQIQGRGAAIAFGKSASGAGRILDSLSVGSARTRDQSDLRKKHIHFGRINTTAEKGGNKDVAALPIERRGGVFRRPCAIEATIFPTQR